MARQAAELQTLLLNHTSNLESLLLSCEEAEQLADIELHEATSELQMLHTQTNVDSDGNAKIDKLFAGRHCQTKKLLLQRDTASRQTEAENYSLREQLAAMQAVQSSAIFGSGAHASSGAMVADPLSANPPCLQVSRTDLQHPLTEAVLNRLETAQRVLQDWSGRPRPKPSPPSDQDSECWAHLPGTLETTTSDEGEGDEEEQQELEPGREGGSGFVAAHSSTRRTRTRSKKRTILDINELARDKYSNSYKVAHLYHEKGWAQHIAKSSLFEKLSTCIIILNAIWIGIDTVYNKEEILSNADAGIIIVENLFCGYFFVEICIRFLAFRHTVKAFKDAWFCFDLVLAALMILETWVLFFVSSIYFNPSLLKLFRLVRLTRMARLTRILRVMPEIMILVQSIGVAARSVFWTLCLLFVVIYVFAVAFTHMLKDTPSGERYFATLDQSFFSLFFHGCLVVGLPEMAKLMFQDGWGWLLMIFIIVAPLTIMNMIFAILVDVVRVVAMTEQEGMDVRFIKTHLQQVLVELGGIIDGHISRREFVWLLEKQEVVDELQGLGFDVVAMAEDPDMIFGGDSIISFKEFMAELLLLRGSNAATVRDLIQMRKQLVMELGKHKRAESGRHSISSAKSARESVSSVLLGSTRSCGGDKLSCQKP